MTVEDLKPGLRHRETITVNEAVPAQARIFDPATEMPPVFATAQMIAFLEWACVHALAPYLAPHQRSVGTRVEMTHLAATPAGMKVTAEVELVAIEGRRLRFAVSCRDEAEIIGEGHHERTIVDNDRFLTRLARKQRGPLLAMTANWLSSRAQRSNFDPRGSRLALQQPEVAQAGVAAAADDEMVVHADADRAGRLDDVARHRDVGL